MDVKSGRSFFVEATAIRGSATPHVLFEIACFGLLATATCCASFFIEQRFQVRLGLEVGWFELASAAVSLLLVLRTNSGYERWWEARRLWGGIVNQSRNLAISATAYGPTDAAWRERFLAWVVAFPYVACASLRAERSPDHVAELIGAEAGTRLELASHRPSAVALELAEMLQEARRDHDMDPWAFAQVDRERAQLIDHIGGCERILKSPLPLVYSIKIRRLIALLLATLPLVLLHRLSADWLVPLVTMMVAYPMVSLDRIGYELQYPFQSHGLAPLPLEDICAGIESAVRGLVRPGNSAPERQPQPAQRS